jgi:regulator of RNase E activity RraA
MTDSDEELRGLIEAFSTLRVADVRDGMDTMMMHGRGSMSPAIRPVWRTRACGIAHTVRYVPYDGTVPAMSAEEYWKWVGWYYKEVCPYPWMDRVRAGDFIVIDQSGVDCGLMGSANTLTGLRAGAVGYVTSGGVRDTDEIIRQRVPVWSAFVSQSMVQGRLKFDSAGGNVEVGGVLVHPGDVVVADGDGVIVVPRGIAPDVAAHADAEHRRDMVARRKEYEALGLPLDETVGGEEAQT